MERRARARLPAWWLGCVVLLACARTGQAQFAQSVILNGWLKAATKAQATISSALGANVSLADVEEAPAPRLPACRYERLLSTQGVPTGWGTTMEMQDMVAHPINAAMLQLAYAVWQDDPAAVLGKCLDNLGVDAQSSSIIHKAVFPYLGTMTALVMSAGDQGMFVSFRGTDFGDPGDVLTDADCQHTEPLGHKFGAAPGRALRLHTGFWRAWESVAPLVLGEIKSRLGRTATKKVYFIGHSLGGAMASIAAVRFQHLVRKSVAAEVGGVWLFGCPRVGNAVWAEEYNRRLLRKTLRFSNFADCAARLPRESQLCPVLSFRGPSSFEFRHVGQSVVLCPDASTGLTRWRLFRQGAENLDCGGSSNTSSSSSSSSSGGDSTPDVPDISVTTHWLGSYFDAWRRGRALALQGGRGNATRPHPLVAAVMCDECSLRLPLEPAKQLNVVARAGGPVGCSCSSSCSSSGAWEAATGVGDGLLSREFNPNSTCVGYLCT